MTSLVAAPPPRASTVERIGTASATLPRLLWRNARAIGDRPAMREKELGIWRTYRWADYAREVEAFALGLMAHHFRRGDKLAVIGDNRPRLYFAEFAAASLGGIAVPVYQDSIASELLYVLNDAEVSVIVAEDQEQVDKVLSLAHELPKLKLLVYDDPRGLAQYDVPILKSFEAVQAVGRELGGTDAGLVEREIEAGDPDDVFLFAYTSGTTGRPKGVMLSHANLMASAQAFIDAEDVRPGDEWLAYLPMAWVGESLFSTVLSVMVGFTCNCPERPETVQRDLREIGPTVVLAPPRIWESMLTQVQVKAADATPLKRRTFGVFRRLAERAELLRAEGKRVPLATRLGLMLGELLVYGPVRDQLGLARARWAYTGGAALGPDTFRFFRAFGVNLKQAYGSTELAAIAALQPDGEADPNTVGRACPGVEVRIAEDDEVQIRSKGICCGYWKQPEASREMLTADGWLRTGDAGFFDPRGHLVIVDRAKDVGRLADGTPFAPQFIENKLKFSPYVGEVVAFGHERPFVAAMVAIDLTIVGNWAERQGLPYTSFQDLSAKPEVRALIRGEVAKCNATLPAASHVRRFVLMNKEFDPDDSEITRTRKVRRRFIAEKYAGVVAALYGGADEIEVATDITYEDGRKAVLRSTLAVEDVGAKAGAEREPAHA